MSTDTRTELDLEAIEARTNAATPGPWGVGNDTNIVRGLEVTGRGSYTCIQSVAEVGDNDDRLDWDRDEAVEVDPEDDAAFIAAARTDVPALVGEVRRLRAELAQIADAVAPTVTITPTVAAVRFLHSLYTDWVATAHERLAKVDEQAAEIKRLRAELTAERKTTDELRDDLRTSDQQYADLQQSLTEARNAVE